MKSKYLTGNLKFYQGDSAMKVMVYTIGLPWITFRRANAYTSVSKLSVIGIPWYDRDEWEKTRKLCEDPVCFNKSYSQRLSHADKAIIALLRRGEPFEPIRIHAQEYAKWCVSSPPFMYHGLRESLMLFPGQVVDSLMPDEAGYDCLEAPIV